ncbi:MAG: outer membrane beta-barrel protein [Desulfobacteraceae bacterium]|nr:outer membrane beta-barrel protein [Desulfobacteraceae bacterium]
MRKALRQNRHHHRLMINRLFIQTVTFGIIFFFCVHAAVAGMPVVEFVADTLPDKTKQKMPDTVSDKPGDAKNAAPRPFFSVAIEADVPSIDTPDIIHYTITVKNTGNMPLTGISISAPLIDDLSSPEGNSNNPGALDVNEIWTYTGSYDATQTVIDANGVDSNNVIDGDGDIDNTVMVDFAETDPPQTAYARVKTEGSIDGNIFGKNKKYLHGFLSVAQSYTTNLYKTDRDPEGCWATFLTPGIWATVPSTQKRSIEIVTANASPGGLAVNPFTPINYKPFQLYFLYSPQLQIYHNQRNTAYQDTGIGEGIVDNEDINQFTNNDSLNRLTHRVDAYISYHSGNKLFLRAMDQYKISYDAFSERAYFVDDKYKSNLFNITGTFDATKKLRLRLDYSNFDLNYKDQMNSDADRMDNSIAAYLFFRMTAKTSAFVEYEFADINYNSSDKDSHEHRYFAGLRWRMTGKSSGQIKGGFGKKTDTSTSVFPDTDIQISDISSSNWMAEIQIDHNFNSRTNFTLNAYRKYDEVLEHRYDYGDLENFYADFILAHFIGFKMSREITSKIHLNLDTSFFYDEFKGSRANHSVYGDSEFDIFVDNPNYQRERHDTEFAVSPSINFTIFKWLTLNGAYIYTDHDSNYPAHDYVDHTFFVRANLFL